MRWTLRISFILFLAWAIFMISPFVALYDLGKAIEARDFARISERVNFRALRISLARQIIGEYLKTPEGQEELGGLNPNVAAGAGAVAFDPFIERLTSPEALIDLLEDGRFQQAGNVEGAAPLRLNMELAFDPETVRRAWSLFISSETQGFRSIVIPLPANEAKERQFKVTLRLSGTTWRITGLDLPQALRKRLADEALLATKNGAALSR